MRDIAITLIVFGAIPFIFSRPYIGILVWSWLGYMNPHRLSFGFAYNFPFAAVVAAVTLIAFFINAEKKYFPWTGLTIVWVLLIFWFNVTTIFAINFDEAASEWNRTMKIQFSTILTVILINNKHRLNLFVLIIALSLGFFGIKGGIFSALTGGSFRVFGPEGSFIEDNNALALALIMILPLFKYLATISTKKIYYWAAYAALPIIALSILTSQSRGALLAGTAMMVFLVLKSQYRIAMGITMGALSFALLAFMPESWYARMETIENYEQDGSAMGRINAWWFAFYLALDRPLVGGGFQAFTEEAFMKYAPNPLDHHDSHSIYFEMLGEQGFIGLFLFLMLGIIAFITGNWIIKKSKLKPSLKWARDLASMVQVCLVGYAVGGAFLGLAYYDLFYHLVSILVILRIIVTRELEKDDDESDLVVKDKEVAIERDIRHYKQARPREN